AFHNSFHGRTLGALTATGQEKYHRGFEPLVPGFVYAEFNDLGSVEKVITEKTGAIIVEPVQGEGGINPATSKFLTGLRRLCYEFDLLLVLDEVQTGLGRTGKMFAYEHYGIKPDIVTLAKSLGGGFPIGAMLARAEVAQAFEPGDHASTFGGNPLGCAVANRVLDILSEEEMLNHITRIGDYLKSRLQSMTGKRKDVKEVRGLGLLLGVEFTREVKPLVDICMQKGLLVIAAGPRVLRLVPPLNIALDEADQGLAILNEALNEWQDE
ncbi:MAG TPA: aminotransferase class III-fold pyridoxal phosphate-dependent enzyme, partial [Syntrophothermus lipocalidus]|nr:aminotransferase class III-fold pyridoxal phosphate-dependent enzyme [Syntrophothermus lipocalidus]